MMTCFANIQCRGHPGRGKDPRRGKRGCAASCGRLFAKRELGEKIVDAMRHRMEHYLSLGVDLGRSTTWRDAIR